MYLLHQLCDQSDHLFCSQEGSSTLKQIGGQCAISFASGTDNVIGVHDLRLAPTRIPSIAESRATQVAQHTDSCSSRTLNVPEGI